MRKIRKIGKIGKISIIKSCSTSVSDCSRTEGGHWTDQSGWSDSATAQSATCRAKVLSNAKNAFERQGTAKKLDEETGLYYYGARYLDPKYSMWLSTDPALGEYLTPDENKKYGVFDHINLNLYHYGGNNPIYYIDPDGRKDDSWVKYIPSNCQLLAREFIKGDTPNWDAQQSWINKNFFGGTDKKQFWQVACCATSILNVVSSVYQKETGSYLSPEQAELALAAAVKDKKLGRER